jgi:hypothetical protein
MKTTRTTSPADLTDDELIASLKDLVSKERSVTVQLIAHLAELDRRRIHLAQGSSSLFTYCTSVLHFSEHAAYLRIEAARAARRFPVILDRIADGSLHLSAVSLLYPHLTEDNHRSSWKRPATGASGRSRRLCPPSGLCLRFRRRCGSCRRREVPA